MSLSEMLLCVVMWMPIFDKKGPTIEEAQQ